MHETLSLAHALFKSLSWKRSYVFNTTSVLRWLQWVATSLLRSNFFHTFRSRKFQIINLIHLSFGESSLMRCANIIVSERPLNALWCSIVPSHGQDKTWHVSLLKIKMVITEILGYYQRICIIPLRRVYDTHPWYYLIGDLRPICKWQLFFIVHFAVKLKPHVSVSDSGKISARQQVPRLITPEKFAWRKPVQTCNTLNVSPVLVSIHGSVETICDTKPWTCKKNFLSEIYPRVEFGGDGVGVSRHESRKYSLWNFPWRTLTLDLRV